MLFNLPRFTSLALALATVPSLALPLTGTTDADILQRDSKSIGLNCVYDSSLPAFHWLVTIPNETPFEHRDGYNHDNCGGGFLDNFRGRCGVITSWRCKYYSNDGKTVLSDQSTNTAQNKLAVMDFWTSAFCRGSDISAAIGAASFSTIVNTDCWDYANRSPGDPHFSEIPSGFLGPEA
jgi:hypothetical protein